MPTKTYQLLPLAMLLLACHHSIQMYQPRHKDNDLHNAVRDSDLSKIKELLSQPEYLAKLNEKGDGGQTPLMISVLQGDFEIFKYLYEDMKADITITEEKGYSAMDGAAFQGRANILKYLLERGFSAQKLHADGYAPYHRACWGKESRHLEAVRTILDSGVDVEFPNKKHETCDQMAKQDEIKLAYYEYKIKKRQAEQAKKKQDL